MSLPTLRQRPAGHRTKPIRGKARRAALALQVEARTPPFLAEVIFTTVLGEDFVLTENRLRTLEEAILWVVKFLKNSHMTGEEEVFSAEYLDSESLTVLRIYGNKTPLIGKVYPPSVTGWA